MPNTVSLTIDGKPVTAPAGSTILEAARSAGITIPSLCHFDGLSGIGACRVCIVEVRGIPRLLPSCVTRATEGMDVTTDSPRVVRYRRMIVELLFSERNHVCATCVSNGNCELQALAQSLGITHTRYPYRYPKLGADITHPRFGHDDNRCILCGRCVRVCQEVEGARTWNIAARGIRSRVVTDLDRPWGESKTCTACGKCVQVCPVGAMFEKGKATGEMAKRSNFLPYIEHMRESAR